MQNEFVNKEKSEVSIKFYQLKPSDKIAFVDKKYDLQKLANNLGSFQRCDISDNNYFLAKFYKKIRFDYINQNSFQKYYKLSHLNNSQLIQITTDQKLEFNDKINITSTYFGKYNIFINWWSETMNKEITEEFLDIDINYYFQDNNKFTSVFIYKIIDNQIYQRAVFLFNEDIFISFIFKNDKIDMKYYKFENIKKIKFIYNQDFEKYIINYIQKDDKILTITNNCGGRKEFIYDDRYVIFGSDYIYDDRYVIFGSDYIYDIITKKCKFLTNFDGEYTFNTNTLDSMKKTNNINLFII